MLRRIGTVLACAAIAGALALVGADQPAGEIWRFDRLDSIGGRAATALGHPQMIDTPIGPAVAFDGVQDALLLDVHPLAGAKTFTMELIFRPDAGGGEEQRFFHLQEVDPKTGRDTASRLMFELRVVEGRWCLDGVAFSGTESKVLIDRTKLHSLGAWHTLALVYDGHELRDYVDGVQEGAGQVELAPQGPGHASIGTRIDRRSFFKGAVFEARMTPRALPPSEFLTVPHFREHLVAKGLAGGYQVVAADLNHDGKPDLIALATRGNGSVWPRESHLGAARAGDWCGTPDQLRRGGRGRGGDSRNRAGERVR